MTIPSITFDSVAKLYINLGIAVIAVTIFFSLENDSARNSAVEDLTKFEKSNALHQTRLERATDMINNCSDYLKTLSSAKDTSFSFTKGKFTIPYFGKLFQLRAASQLKKNDTAIVIEMTEILEIRNKWIDTLAHYQDASKLSAIDLNSARSKLEDCKKAVYYIAVFGLIGAVMIVRGLAKFEPYDKRIQMLTELEIIIKEQQIEKWKRDNPPPPDPQPADPTPPAQ